MPAAPRRAALRHIMAPVSQFHRRFAAFVCIDWSGAAIERPAGIAVAIARGNGAAAPRLITPAGGWTRAKIVQWLRGHARRGTDMLIGFDLSPAFPFIDCGAYFPQWRLSPPDPQSLWQLVDEIASDDPFLVAPCFVDHADAARHFRRHGGRVGDLFPGGIGRLRAVEQRQRTTGQARSASCFNLVGAAQVGKASLSGMRLFHALGGAIPFWPFDPLPATGPALVEIYTSLAARASGVPAHRSKVRDAETLIASLDALGSRAVLPQRLDDHATDALITAAWMRRAAAEPAHWHPESMDDDIRRTEGWTFGVV